MWTIIFTLMGLGALLMLLVYLCFCYNYFKKHKQLDESVFRMEQMLEKILESVDDMRDDLDFLHRGVVAKSIKRIKDKNLLKELNIVRTKFWQETNSLQKKFYADQMCGLASRLEVLSKKNTNLPIVDGGGVPAEQGIIQKVGT